MATKMSGLFGRKVIYSDVDEITAENIFNVIETAFQTHDTNVSQTEYLFNYYKGDQPINTRTKTIRDDIVNMICENRAKQIVDFKVGYLFGEPVQYVSSGTVDEKVSEKISTLNSMMREQEMDSKNEQLGEWQAICGTAYKMILQKLDNAEDESLSPFEVYVPEPQQAFIIYSSGLGHKPLAGVYYVVDADDVKHISVYTENEYFKLKNFDVVEERGVNGIGFIPIIEYPANNAKLGAFEPVLSLLDALNELDSDRIDGVDQFIQSLVIALNCDFEEGTSLSDLMKTGIVSLRSSEGMNQDVKILTEQLDQSQTQVLKEDLIKAVLEICSMPNRNGGYSTSDTGVAVVYRDGWSSAESDAKKAEMPFKRSERKFLEVALHICSTMANLEIALSDIDIHFDRRNYENIEMKATVLTQMLSNPMIAPRLSFEMCNMFPDAESAYQESLPYIEAYLAQQSTTEKSDTNNSGENQ